MFGNNSSAGSVVGWIAIGVVVTVVGLAALGATHAHGQRTGRAKGQPQRPRQQQHRGRHGGLGGATFGDSPSAPSAITPTSTPTGSYNPGGFLNPFIGLAAPQSGDIGPGVNDNLPTGIDTPSGGYL